MPADASAPPQPSLSIFFPAYNDAGTIASLVIRAVKTAERLTADFEVIVVNDGSADATGAIADELCRTYPQVRVVHHAAHRLCLGHQGVDRLHGRRRAVRPG